MAKNELAKDESTNHDLASGLPQDPEARAKFFRRSMALWPAGVTIAAADDGEALHGLTVSSFTSVSLDPPLCLICLRNETPLLPILRRAGRFAVHVLAADQENVAKLFADGEAEERLKALERAPGQPPRLERFLARFSFSLWDETPAGDHKVVIGAVERIETTQGDVAELREAAFADLPGALTWWRSRMGSLAPRQDR